MWWELQGEQVVKDTIATSFSVREGVDRLLKYFQIRYPHAVWQKMAHLDYETDVKAIQEWFAEQLPFPDSIEVLRRCPCCGLRCTSLSSPSRSPACSLACFLQLFVAAHTIGVLVSHFNRLTAPFFSQ